MVPALMVVEPEKVFKPERVSEPGPIFTISKAPLITPEIVREDVALLALKLIILSNTSGQDMEATMLLLALTDLLMVSVSIVVLEIVDAPLKTMVLQVAFAVSLGGLVTETGIMTRLVFIGTPEGVQFEAKSHLSVIPLQVFVCPFTKFTDTVQNSIISATGNFNLCIIVFIKLI